jgi:hypothetical protein
MLRASPRQLNPQLEGYVEPVDRFAIFRLGVTLRYVASRRADWELNQVASSMSAVFREAPPCRQPHAVISVGDWQVFSLQISQQGRSAVL